MLMMTDLSELSFGGVESATKTHGDREKDLSGVSVSRWSKNGNDRLYLNGLFTSTTDVYVDLERESVTVSGTQVRSTGVQIDGDELAVEIDRPSSKYEIRVTIGDDGDDTTTDDSESNAAYGDERTESALEDLGVDI